MKKTMVTKKEKPRYNKTHDCRCQTKLIATVFKAMSQEKKDIVEEMGFGMLAHVLEMNVSHILLRELIDCYDDYNGFLNTLHRKIYITPDKYDGLNEADKQTIDGFKCVTLASLTKSVLNISVEGEENRQIFRRTFVVFIQKYFLLPTTVSTASLIHKLPGKSCSELLEEGD
ncbi:hypothetical protein Ahy_A06g029401 [Arachis hypogaea]|uniref:Uncharacterized protein n=1 Tax=Arachis hypogaea TaxID=3818 RepID=A0A445CT53_ARAHY|nr:hypothetical protein Ahy_A06g029401 [Arachis hypogaea]